MAAAHRSFAEYVKNRLLSLIQEMASLPWLFVKNPAADFSRRRKLDFASTIQFILSMENGGLKNELLDYFRFSVDTPSASAFNQQRSKLLPETFPFCSMNLILFSHPKRIIMAIAC